MSSGVPMMKQLLALTENISFKQKIWSGISTFKTYITKLRKYKSAR